MKEKEKTLVTPRALAVRIDRFMHDFDPYEYADQVDDPETNIEIWARDIANGDAQYIIEELALISPAENVLTKEDFIERNDILDGLNRFERSAKGDVGIQNVCFYLFKGEGEAAKRKMREQLNNRILTAAHTGVVYHQKGDHFSVLDLDQCVAYRIEGGPFSVFDFNRFTANEYRDKEFIRDMLNDNALYTLYEADKIGRGIA